MKVRFLGLAVVLVALAVIVNALALSSATITSPLTVSVVNTDTALLAFSAVSPGGDPDLTVSGNAASLSLAVQDGIQRNSSYTFAPAFMITNNSADTLNLTVSGTATNGVTITAAALTSGTHGSFTAVGPGKTVHVSLTFAADGTAVPGTPVTATLTVGATRP